MLQGSKRPLTEDEMARRAGQEIKDGNCVNLGAGIPFPVVNYIPKDIWAMVHIEHGILGVGGTAQGLMRDRDCMGLGGGLSLPCQEHPAFRASKLSPC